MKKRTSTILARSREKRSRKDRNEARSDTIQTRRNFRERREREREREGFETCSFRCNDVTRTLRPLPVVSRQVKYRRRPLISAAAHDFFVNGSMPAELHSHIDRTCGCANGRGNTRPIISRAEHRSIVFIPTGLIQSWFPADASNVRSCHGCRN